MGDIKQDLTVKRENIDDDVWFTSVEASNDIAWAHGRNINRVLNIARRKILNLEKKVELLMNAHPKVKAQDEHQS